MRHIYSPNLVAVAVESYVVKHRFRDPPQRVSFPQDGERVHIFVACKTHALLTEQLTPGTFCLPRRASLLVLVVLQQMGQRRRCVTSDGEQKHHVSADGTPPGPSFAWVFRHCISPKNNRPGRIESFHGKRTTKCLLCTAHANLSTEIINQRV